MRLLCRAGLLPDLAGFPQRRIASPPIYWFFGSAGRRGIGHAGPPAALHSRRPENSHDAGPADERRRGRRRGRRPGEDYAGQGAAIAGPL